LKNEIAIRKLTKKDLDGCAAIFIETFNGEPWNDYWDAETARQRLSDILDTPGSIGLVAKHGTHIVGFCLGHVEQWYSGYHFLMKEMAVRPGKQRTGIGTALMNALLPQLIEIDVQVICLNTLHGSPAEAFYEQLGFRQNMKMRMMTMGI
jgi:aminoglycoside 6'-N-acetyltransferase I